MIPPKAGIADADHDSISPARSGLRRRVSTRTATSARPQGVDPRRLQYPSSQRLWLVRRRRARSLRPDRDGSEGASALAADGFGSRFAVPCNRRIEADHCLKINPEWTWLRQSNATHRTIGDVERPERFIRSPLAHLPRPVAFAPRQSSSLSRERPAGRAAYSGVHAFAQKVRPKTGLHHAHEDRTD